MIRIVTLDQQYSMLRSARFAVSVPEAMTDQHIRDVIMDLWNNGRFEPHEAVVDEGNVTIDIATHNAEDGDEKAVDDIITLTECGLEKGTAMLIKEFTTAELKTELERRQKWARGRCKVVEVRCEDQ